MPDRDPNAAYPLVLSLVLEDGRRWGEAAEPWQRADARAILDTSPDAPPWHFLTRPRGGSKTGDVAAVSLAWLLYQAEDRARGYGLAADRDQGALLVDAMAGFVHRTPELAAAVQVDAFRVTARRSLATLDVLPADEASSWGLSPRWLVVDELAQWGSGRTPRRLWRSVVSSTPKKRPRLVVMTSAGDPGHWSHEVLVSARRRTGRWRVSEVPGPVPWQEAEDLTELEAVLPAWEFSRLVLNEWTSPADRLTTVDDLGACVVLEEWPRRPVPGRAYAVGVDLGLKNDRTAVAVCSTDVADGHRAVALDRLAVWQGSRAAPVDLGEVEAWLLEAWLEYGRPPVLVDPYQAAQLTQRLRARGVAVEEYAFSQRSISRLALRLHQLIADHALALPEEAELLDELANVRLDEVSPGVYRLDHEPGQHDDRAIAIALAAHALYVPPLEGPERVVLDPGSGEYLDADDPRTELVLEAERRISPY